jgi:hypothetical protein
MVGSDQSGSLDRSVKAGTDGVTVLRDPGTNVSIFFSSRDGGCLPEFGKARASVITLRANITVRALFVTY